MKCRRLSLLFVSVLAVILTRTLAQDAIDFGVDDREEAEKFAKVIEGLCSNRPPNEYFRLSTESNCRDAVRCVANDFDGGHSLAAVRCPNGLVFDLDEQTCDWASKVHTFIHSTTLTFSGVRMLYIALGQNNPRIKIDLRTLKLGEDSFLIPNTQRSLVLQDMSKISMTTKGQNYAMTMDSSIQNLKLGN